jgi:hypothetical protein
VTLLRDIQEGATNEAVSVAELLRKALILARRLDYEPLKDWAEQELEGYGPNTELPDYRAYRACHVLGDFSGPMNSWRKNQPLPSGAVAEEHRRHLFGYDLREGVVTYESLLSSGDGDLSISWDPNYVVQYQEDFFELMALTAARRVVGRSEIAQLIGAIRTRLLNFSLEIEAANPDAGEADPGSQPVAVENLREAFNVTVLGDNNVVNAAGGDARQEVTVGGPAWDELKAALERLGVSDADVTALGTALADDATLTLPRGSVGPAVAGWLKRLNDAVAAGVVSLPTEVAGGMIAAEILKYLGAS